MATTPPICFGVSCFLLNLIVYFDDSVIERIYVCISGFGNPGCTLPSRMLREPRITTWRRWRIVCDSKRFETRRNALLAAFFLFWLNFDEHCGVLLDN